MTVASIRNWMWVGIGLLVPVGASLWGYLSGAWVVTPAMAAAQVIILQAQRFTLGPLFLGTPLFIYGGIVVFLYLLFLVWKFRKNELKFPFLLLLEGTGASVGMYMFFGFSIMWILPLMLFFYIFAAIFWHEQIEETRIFKESPHE